MQNATKTLLESGDHPFNRKCMCFHLRSKLVISVRFIVSFSHTDRRMNVLRLVKWLCHQDGETRYVTQYHYTTWPDHGIPTATALVDFWRTVRTSYRNLKSPAPLLVHCRSVLVEFSSALWGFPFQTVMLIITTK